MKNDYRIRGDFLVEKVNKSTGKSLKDEDGLPILFKIPIKDRLRINEILQSIDINELKRW